METLIIFIDFCSNHFDQILTTGMFIVAFFAMRITVKAFNEQNRPYITFNYEEHSVGNYYYIIVRNTGLRGATDVKISIDPPLNSFMLKDRDSISIIDFDFIAPNQLIRSTFDYSIFRHNEENGAKVEKHKVIVCYKYKNRNFIEKYSLDLTYLKTWLGGDVDSKSTKHLKDIADHLKKIEVQIKKGNTNS